VLICVKQIIFLTFSDIYCSNDLSINLSNYKCLFGVRCVCDALSCVISFMLSSMELLQQRMAQEVLTTLKEHPDAWTRVDTILEYSQSQQTKYYALQILENVIKTRWKVLPRPQCEGVTCSLPYIISSVCR